MNHLSSLRERLRVYGIFALCFGYFATYIPFSMLTKLSTKGLLEGMNGKGFDGFTIQPMVALATVVCMFTYLSVAGWWRYTAKVKILGFNVSRPRWFTFVSGLCLGGIVATTVLAYTFSGISIIFAMLLMRGGVLVMGPVVDLLAKRKRHIYWPSWIAGALALSALFITFESRAGFNMSLAASINIGIYLFCYFFRLLFMSNRAKTDNSEEKRGYLAEEQLVANVGVFLVFGVLGLLGSMMDPASVPGLVWQGFTALPRSGYLGIILLIGLFNYCVGTFGTLIILDKRENTFTMAANRTASVIAGVVASYFLAFWYAQSVPGTAELKSVALIMIAILFLTYRVALDKKRKDR